MIAHIALTFNISANSFELGWVIPTGYGKLKIITGSCPVDSYYGKTEHGDHNSKQGWKDICAFAVCIASLILGTIPHIFISYQASAKCK